MWNKRSRARWPQGVRLEDFPEEAQRWAEQHANDDLLEEWEAIELPALRSLVRLISWKQALCDLWNLLRNVRF